MRTGEGRRHSAALIKKELVKTKGQDLVYMAEQRARLDAGETERLRSLRGQQRRARQQQRAILAITLVGLVLLAAAVIVVVTLVR
jgi:lipopolysaccharide export LptBFGC system permease protein LptF